MCRYQNNDSFLLFYLIVLSRHLLHLLIFFIINTSDGFKSVNRNSFLISIPRKQISMAKNLSYIFSFRHLCYILFTLSIFSFILFLYWCHSCGKCYSSYQITQGKRNQPINLLRYPFAWNHLSFSSEPPPKFLKIALFVKKWPHRSHAGGLERHALTLHLALAKRGHDLHVFTTSSSNFSFQKYPMNNLYFHLSKPTPGGYLDQATVWEQFQEQNSTGRPFDIVHTESVGLRHTRSRYVSDLAVTWHGIAYETIHSDIIQELLRSPQESQGKTLSERAIKVVEEVKFFPNYAHHVATSDHAGDILKRVYMIPEERVHIILNGVDEDVFRPDTSKRKEFKQRLGIADSKSLVIGLAGRLVKDKGHPLMFEALKQIIAENSTFRESSTILVAGDGPWAARYRDLGSNTQVLGPLDQAELASFYNAIDIFVNPTLRAQGMDHTLLEAMLSGKPVMATRLASIVGSVIVGTEMGYTFSPTVTSLKKAIYEVCVDGRGVLDQKGHVARHRSLQLFTATKMVASYERLFLCISSGNHEGSLFVCAKYFFWWIVDILIRKELLKILFHVVSQKRIWQKPFQQNPEWQFLWWIWRILHVLVYVHCIWRRSILQQSPNNFRIRLRIRE